MTTAGAGAGANPLRVGFVGGGFMAQVHSRAARACRARLVGIVSSTPVRSEQAAAALGIERAFDSLEDMLASEDVDVVHVCTPNVLHAEQAAAVIRAGKHIVCEKPLATSVTDAAELTELAASAGVTATVPFVYRFHPMVREARAHVRAGSLGRLLSVQGSYLQDWLLESDDDNWRVDSEQGGRSRAFADIGSHLVDLVEFVSGDRIARVAATMRTYFDSRAQNSAIATEDAAALAIETEAGALGTLLVSQVAPGRKNRLKVELAGASESLAFDQEQPETLWIGRRHGTQVIPRDAEQLSPDAARLITVPAGHPQGYQDAFNAFVSDSYAAIGGATPEGLPRFADGLRAARITDAVIDAAASARWVSVG